MHRIPGVARAHPAQWKGADPSNRSWVQWNWERFLRRNPALRPGSPKNFRWGAIAWLVTHTALRSRAGCTRPDCPGCGSRPLLEAMFDHGELWQTQSDGVTVPVCMGHPYRGTEELREMAAQVIAACTPYTSNLAAYIGEGEQDWYNPPSSGCILFQPADAPPVHGWNRVGPAEPVAPPRAPRRAGNTAGLHLAVSNREG